MILAAKISCQIWLEPKYAVLSGQVGPRQYCEVSKMYSQKAFLPWWYPPPQYITYSYLFLPPGT